MMKDYVVAMPVRVIFMIRIIGFLGVALVSAITMQARAELGLPMVIGDHMVLQRDANVPIWGTAEPGKEVVVTFADQFKKTTANADGRWRVDLDPMPASISSRVLKVECDGKILTCEDVLVGEVWLCAGQSNMQFGLSHAEDGEAEVAKADDPLLRLLRIENHVVERGEDAVGAWAGCTPESAEKFSAVGYYYGLKLRAELGMPVGLISSAWGATTIESWTPIEVIRDGEAFASTRERDRIREREQPRMMSEYEAKVAQWKQDRDAAEAAGKKLPQPPRMPVALRPQSQSGSLYDSMIYPIVPFAMRGAVWYQGESNVGGADRYQPMLMKMIEAWRSAWGQQQYYYGIVQLPNYRPVAIDPGDSEWATLREAQRLAARSLPDTGLAVTIDLGDAENGHPQNKRDVGERLARWALDEVYEGPKVGHGPVLEDAKIVDDRVELRFSVDAGALISSDDRPIGGFAIAGADQKWRWAHVEVTGNNQVSVWHEEIARPVTVRYAWADNPPVANLTDASGIPASPFQVTVNDE